MKREKADCCIKYGCRNPNLHLRAAVLEPELDLPRFKAQILAELQPLLVVGVRALLEQSNIIHH